MVYSKNSCNLLKQQKYKILSINHLFATDSTKVVFRTNKNFQVILK